MTQTHPHTQVVAEPGQPSVRLTREFDAPVAHVFRAHTDPELLVQWLGPRRLRMTVDRYDARDGGSYRYEHHDADGTAYGFYGVFHEVRADERIVQTFTFEGMPDSVSLEVAVFTDLGGRTLLTIDSVCTSVESRDAMIASGMETGIREGYERLDALLAGAR